jgi:hypothetical protein
MRLRDPVFVTARLCLNRLDKETSATTHRFENR